MTTDDWKALCDISNFEDEITQFVISRPITQNTIDLAMGALILQTIVLPLWSSVANDIVRGN